MNSMFPVWTLSALIFSYTLGLPIFNNSSRGSYMETFPNVTMKNFTVFNKINQTRSDFVMTISLSGCVLPTCAVHRLDDMKGGDEEAGTITSDPWGPGKK